MWVMRLKCFHHHCTVATIQSGWEQKALEFELFEREDPTKSFGVHENKSDFKFLSSLRVVWPQDGIAHGDPRFKCLIIASPQSPPALQKSPQSPRPLQNVKSALQKVQQRWVHHGFPFLHCILPTLLPHWILFPNTLYFLGRNGFAFVIYKKRPWSQAGVQNIFGIYTLWTSLCPFTIIIIIGTWFYNMR